MKLVLLILSMAWPAFAASVPMPPMPKVPSVRATSPNAPKPTVRMRRTATVAPQLSLIPASVPPTAGAIYISPKLAGGGGFPDIHIITAEQLANHSTVVEMTQTPSAPRAWQFLAGYGCYPNGQFVIATVPNRSTEDYPWIPNWAFVRAVNTPCTMAPVGVVGASDMTATSSLNQTPILSPDLKAWTGTNSLGMKVKIGAEILPAYTNGVRRFLSVTQITP